MFFFLKKKRELFKIGKDDGKFAVECVSIDVFSQNVFSTSIMGFFGKRLRNFESWKIGKYDEERVYFEDHHICLENDSKLHLWTPWFLQYFLNTESIHICLTTLEGISTKNVSVDKNFEAKL